MAKAVVALNKPNATGYFYPADDRWEMKIYPFAASVGVVEGAAVARQIVSNDVTGNLSIATVENAAGADFVGIMAEPITSGDADYATAGKLKGVRVPKLPLAQSYFTVGAGTFTAADVGKAVELHSDFKTLAVDTKGKGARITAYISSTKGKCTFSMPTTETA
jgi:hypothetical protein